MKIPFNKPYITGLELDYISDSINSRKLAGDGPYTKKVHAFFKNRYSVAYPLLTTSCTDALEMSAILAGIDSDSEVIMPSFTFVSTANAFILRGAKVVFVDSLEDTPNIDPQKIEEVITVNTRAIVVVHYAGVACNMDAVLEIAKKHDLFVIEDAAQGINSYYENRPLGTLGDFGTFSFHETKNIISGEGGLLSVNNPEFAQRAEIIREKGTNRSAFFRGEIDKYSWVDIGSSYLATDLIAAFLFAQLESLDLIQLKRMEIWERYYSNLKQINYLLPKVPHYATQNGHIFYIKCRNHQEQISLIEYLASFGIAATFHYLPLHTSEFFKSKHDGRVLSNSKNWSDVIVRLPLYPSLSLQDVDFVSEKILSFYES